MEFNVERRAGVVCRGVVNRVTPLLLAAAMVTYSSTGFSAEIESSIVRGGQLYDKWHAVLDVEPPTASHSAYPADKKYADKAKDNWRCKECHGWDYMGKDGAYKSGKHESGIKGINGMAGAPTNKILAVLKDKTHGYGTKLSEADYLDLARFVSQGQFDMDPYIDRSTKTMKGGDPAKGEAYFNTICANCHGKDGLLPKEMEPFGKLMGNPWEMMHKVVNGQPAEKMPALRLLDRQVVVDILSHMATLPKQR